ncbi:hypothetical protein EGW08_015454 [Elysia chlorotica]|uniref:G-protein coupled receptors family 1 profile domain-containing protein n=1 Tax=Elysia chlorotica TaxID=188477 RepID=A0A3S0ZW81_ELYCH|nr:hypothetical protein EGW08_015454 [Elysia chlorotica]
MSGDTPPLANWSLAEPPEMNSSSHVTGTNASNGTGTAPQDGPGLARMALVPEIPGWVSSLYLCMLCLSILVGVPGNALTLAAYARIKNKTSCDWYILVVALTDLASCLFRSPVYILEHKGVWLRYSTSDLCKFISWLSQTTVCVSIFIFALVAIDRYIKLCHTFKWNISPKRARLLCLIIVVTNSVLAAPCLYIFENLTRGVCQVKVPLQQNVLVKGYYR